ESDACTVEQQIGFAAALGLQFGRGTRQPAGELPVVRANRATRIVHFIKKTAGHAVLLVTRTGRPLQGPRHENKTLYFNILRFNKTAESPNWCGLATAGGLRAPIHCRLAMGGIESFDFARRRIA